MAGSCAVAQASLVKLGKDAAAEGKPGVKLLSLDAYVRWVQKKAAEEAAEWERAAKGRPWFAAVKALRGKAPMNEGAGPSNAA